MRLFLWLFKPFRSMKKEIVKCLIIILIGTVGLIFPSLSFAFEITSDPQYIVINFSDSFHYLDWSAPEEKWQKEIKPQAIKRLRNIKAILTTGTTKDRQLAWSTLLEYTNYPLDDISDNSPYIIRLKRIMELAETEDFPVFIPLNGIQWWDELPELWNWWDFDGNQTPGCTNDNYKNCGFKKLQNPEYRKRFIKGYNPENKWNVDWSDWQTPMKFAVRNWGNGDFLVAPSANIANHQRTPLSFSKLQKNRFEALVKTISATLERWEKEKKQYLFAGLSIGTEVTLNTALLPGDAEFKPYGYRAIQDSFCPFTIPTCGVEKSWTLAELNSMREKIIFQYFNELTRLTSNYHLPRQRVYTHVWSEADPGELKYTNALGASITYFSRPGLSLYGKATHPLDFSLLSQTLENNGWATWAAPEFAPLVRDELNWQTALNNTLNNSLSSAKLIDIYNETEILKTPAIPALQSTLNSQPKKIYCFISETLPITANFIKNPDSFDWKTLQKEDQAEKLSFLIWKKNTFPGQQNDNIKEYPINDVTMAKFNKPKGLERGFYYWAVKRIGCQNTKWTISTPRLFFNFPILPEVDLPWWVKLLIK